MNTWRWLVVALGVSACSAGSGDAGPDTSLVVPASGVKSLGVTPLPGGLLGVDGKANINLVDLDVAADGALRTITSNTIQTQQSAITVVQAGVLRDGKFIAEPQPEDPTGIIGEGYYAYGYTGDFQTGVGSCTCGHFNHTLKLLDGSGSASWMDPTLNNYTLGKLDSFDWGRLARVGTRFYIPVAHDAALTLNKIVGSTVTDEGTVATLPDAYYLANDAAYAEDAGGAYIAYCEIQGGTYRFSEIRGTALVVTKRAAGTTMWTELTRQADACPVGVPRRRSFEFFVVGGTPALVVLDDVTHSVAVLAATSATAFTKSTVAIPTTDAILMDLQDGKLHVGYSDSTQAGKATIARVENGALVPVGQAGFTKDVALIAPRFRGGRVFGTLVNSVAVGLEFVELK